jgi:hypothetical protein
MARRRSHAPPFMRRFQRKFPQPEEKPAEPTLKEMMDSWEDETPEPAPSKVAKEPEPEDPPKAKAEPVPVDKLMSNSRKKLIKMADDMGLEIPSRATKREIATVIAGATEES